MRIARQRNEGKMKTQVQRNAEEFKPGRNHPPRKRSRTTVTPKSQTLAIVPPGSQRPVGRKATGPRTQLGKQRASRNAIKHGVLSEVVLLPGESPAEYERLWAGLRKYFQPEGAAEEICVEKLATDLWRKRRLLLAEGAEIRTHMESFESDRRDQEREEADGIMALSDLPNSPGLIQEIHNPYVLERCLELFSELKGQIKENGFNKECDTAVLKRIYGDRGKNRLDEDLYDSYETWLTTSEASEEERAREGYSSPEECREVMEALIESEIRLLKRLQKAQASVKTEQTKLELVRYNVPDAPELDRLLRYEASLERNFDRTLSQLEHLQRTRRGQPVLPKLEVRHSLS